MTDRTPAGEPSPFPHAYGLRLADLADGAADAMARAVRLIDDPDAVADAVAVGDAVAVHLQAVARLWHIEDVPARKLTLSAGPTNDWAILLDAAGRVRHAAVTRAVAGRFDGRQLADGDGSPAVAGDVRADLAELVAAAVGCWWSALEPSTDEERAFAAIDASRRLASALERADAADRPDGWPPALARVIRVARALVNAAGAAVDWPQSCRPEFDVVAFARRGQLVRLHRRAFRALSRVASRSLRSTIEAELACLSPAALPATGDTPADAAPAASGLTMSIPEAPRLRLLGPAVPDDAVPPSHASDFSSVNWFGELYDFTPSQSAAVRLLWEEWERGRGFGLREATLAERLGGVGGYRVANVFRGHPALGNMIAAGPSKGVFRLCAQNKPQRRTSLRS